MVALLAFYVKIEKSILKNLIAKGISVTILDGNISWYKYFFGDRGAAATKWTIWHCEKPSIRFKMAATVGELIVPQLLLVTQYLSSDRV